MADIIARCITIKADIVSRDERDTGERMLLNFGHTLAHAIETIQCYSGLCHGEAVSVGMHLICRVAEAKGLTDNGTADAIERCLHTHNLPSRASLGDTEKLFDILSRDKKNMGASLFVVLLNKIGESRLYETTPDFFSGVVKWLQ